MTEQQIMQEPLIRFSFKEKSAIICTSTGEPLEALGCFCCSGLNCCHHEGSHLRLWNDVKAKPWKYEDRPWVYDLTPALRKLRRSMR